MLESQHRSSIAAHGMTADAARISSGDRAIVAVYVGHYITNHVIFPIPRDLGICVKASEVPVQTVGNRYDHWLDRVRGDQLVHIRLQDFGNSLDRSIGKAVK